MSFASTLDLARDLLMLPPDATAAETLQNARDRHAEWTAKSRDPRSPAPARSGAARRLNQISPLLPLLEIEAEMAELEAGSLSPGPAIYKLRLDQKKLIERIGALPEGDERAVFAARCEAVGEALQPKVIVTPPVEPPPDPARAVLEAKLDELREALARKEKSKSRLTGLLDAARALALVLRDESARTQANATIEDLAQKLASLLEATTNPPFEDPTRKLLAGKISALHAAVAQGNLSRAPFLLEDARELAAGLRDADARAAADAELDAIELRVAELQAPPPPPLPDPAEAIFAERLAAARAALDREDPAQARALLTQAAETAGGLREDEARRRAEAEIAALADDIKTLDTELAAEAVRQQTATDRLAILRQALEEERLPAAREDLAAAQTAVAALRAGAPRSEREAELAALAERLQKLTAEARRETELRREIEAKCTAIRLALQQRNRGAAEGALGELATLIAALQPGPAREAATGEQTRLLDQLKQLGDPPPRQPEPGRMLKLVPADSAQFTGASPIPVHFVARPRFIVGREPKEGPPRADFLTPKAIDKLSREQVTFAQQGEDIVIQDGVDKKRSANGTKLDDELLSTEPRPASFTSERTLSLGVSGVAKPIFTLGVRHLKSGTLGGPGLPDLGPITAGGKTLVVGLLSGCLRLQPRDEGLLPWQSVWIFTDASIGAAPDNAVVLPGIGLADVQCRIHYSQEAFWIETLRSGSAVRLGDRVLAKGETAPLNTGDLLHLAQMTYKVAIEP